MGPADATETSNAAAVESSSIPQWAFHHHDSLEWSRRDSLEHSRHRTDFESLLFLGRGAFGVCRKVKNRVDHHVYCLKSILISSSNDTDYILREAQVLSSLPSHANVVRYYGAFVEKLEVQQQEELLVGDDGASDSWEDWTPTTASQDHEQSKGDPVCHLCQSSYKDWEVSFEHWGLIDAVLQPHDLCIPCYTKSVPPNSIDKISIRQQAVLHDYLFILMEFCEFTLPEALLDAKDDMIIWNYFGQAVQGVAHLHAQGVIHRDVKPPNIFVHQGIVKIGDLGLASAGISMSNSACTDESTMSSSQASHSSQVGTVLYTAPEVSTGHYNQACDVYSLGVVLVELWSTPFSTAMERVDVLSRLKHGELPNVLHPIAASLARTMVATDPTQRPTCLEILETLTHAGVWNGLQSSESQSVSKLQAELIKSQQETLRLRKLLDQHNIPY